MNQSHEIIGRKLRKKQTKEKNTKQKKKIIKNRLSLTNLLKIKMKTQVEKERNNKYELCCNSKAIIIECEFRENWLIPVRCYSRDFGYNSHTKKWFFLCIRLNLLIPFIDSIHNQFFVTLLNICANFVSVIPRWTRKCFVLFEIALSRLLRYAS